MATKKDTILAILHQRSLNRFEAERHGDHCLHSTISTLTAEGHAFYSQWEVVETRFKPTRVKRYFLLRAA
ncbi:helix-turn-helix domain-containing protein [Eoetvoesiella caeni]